MSLRVSLAAAPVRSRTMSRLPPPRPIADPPGAHLVLGSAPDLRTMVAPLAPTASSLFGPRGADLGSSHGPLVVCDTGHHRVLVWKRIPEADYAPADLVMGQPDFTRESRNAGGAIGAATLSVPSAVAISPNVFAVADAWNHRVLLWHGAPETSAHPPDVVLGQADFHSGFANRGRPKPGDDTLNWCYGLALDHNRLYVADTGNRRILVWNEIPKRHGAPADLVLGQHDFGARDAAPQSDGVGMRWPHGITVKDSTLFVADAGASRVMVWKALPRRNGVPCDFALGQRDLSGTDHNRGEYLPAASTMNMPYGVAAYLDQLVVADTANSRLLGYNNDVEALAMGGAACSLAGQASFEEKGDNRWKAPTRDSLCWPYGVAARDGVLAVADTGNNRVLMWGRA